MTERLRKMFQLIHCRGCGLSSHLICYGIKTDVQELSHEKFGRVKTFECDKCKADAQSTETVNIFYSI